MARIVYTYTSGGLIVKSWVNLEYIARGGSSINLRIDLLTQEAVIRRRQLVDLRPIYELVTYESQGQCCVFQSDTTQGGLFIFYNMSANVLV